jgi:hypothetical protein
MSPSTQWKERIAANEAERYERYARDFARMQENQSRRFGEGRALHRKQILAAKASFEVLSGLPEPARQGLFAAPATHEAWVRLSNGSAMRQADGKPDVRGFAIKALGVSGPSALGNGAAPSQDFLLINQSAFGFAGAEDFVGLVLAASTSGGALLKYLVGRYGLIGAIGFLVKFARALGKPFRGFASESFYSAAPLACGPYACRVRLVPLNDPPPAPSKDWRLDFAGRLAKAPLAFDFQLQFFVDEASTPIEDASVDWPEAVAPYQTVARLTLPIQEIAPAGQGFDAEVEAAAFDPWMALADHRPLGDVMRARKVVYFRSEKERGAISN